IPLLAFKQCPEGYKLRGDVRYGFRCIRALYLIEYGPVAEVMRKGIRECRKDGAILPVIRNYEEDKMFMQIITGIFPENNGQIMGLVCNKKTRRLEWMDGSPVTYVNTNVADMLTLDYDCVDIDHRFVSHAANRWWSRKDPTDESWWVLLCVMPTP
ncbi:hypothetical protein PFISCL1PPCAC_17688, partial [Pristionchus fissidentatus]